MGKSKQPIKHKEPKQELRSVVPGSQLELRESNGSKKLSGYIAVFNSPANIGGQFVETIAPGAFAKTITADDQLLLRDHNFERVLARRSAGSLTLREDTHGLYFEASLPETELARETYELIKNDVIRGCSLGFFVRDDVWSQEEGNLARVIKDAQVFEVTITPIPAYASTSVDARSIRAQLAKQAKREDNADDDPQDDEERCECDCDACEEGHCDECTNPDCDDDDCADCPIQTRAAHLQLLIRRLK